MTELTTCPKCSCALESGMRFCPGCGHEALLSGDTVPGLAAPTVSTEPFMQIPEQMELLRQVTIGEYEILGELGQGGMATVFLANDLALERKVAIKLMSPTLLQGTGLAERFRREARTAASLSHPHIIPIYAVKEDPRALYFAMKYIPGRSLESILRDTGPLPFPMVRSILTEVGSALDHAHRRGVIHRDVKPGNIMVDEDGFAVVTDFGIAKALQSPGITQTGTMVGTPSFLSPEACLGDEVTALSDQYSLGIVAYQMLTGELPFTASTSMGFLYAQVHTPPIPVKKLRRGCPPELHAAVMRMLNKNAAERWPTLKDAVSAISASVPPITDADRSAIGALARSRLGRKSAEYLATPTSPIPTSSRRPHPSTAEMAALTEPLPWRIARGAGRRAFSTPWLLGAAGIAGAALAGWLLFGRASTPPAPVPVAVVPASPPPVEQNDSLHLAARGAATYARERAVAAGASPKTLARGDSLKTVADSMAAWGRKAQAAVLLTEAAAAWNAAEHATAPTRSKGTPGPANRAGPAVPDRTAPERPAGVAESTTVAKPELSDSQVVLNFYAGLSRAIAARQLGEVRRLLPNLNETEDRRWRSLFEDRNVDSIGAEFTVALVSRRGETIYALVRSVLRVIKGGKTDVKEKTHHRTLTLGPEGWREIRAEELR